MNELQERLMAQTGLVGDQVIKRQLLQISAQQLSTDEAQTRALPILWSLLKMRQLAPILSVTDVDFSPLDDLKTALKDEDADLSQSLADFNSWLKSLSPELPAGEDDRPSTETDSALNGRMRDNLNGLRSATDSTRTRLLIAGEDFDRAAFTKAKNALGFASAVYDEKLRLDLAQATNEECAQIEAHLDDLKNASGDNFTSRLTTAANFIVERVVLQV